MTGPTSVPRGEHAPRPAPAWAVTWLGEHLADTDQPEPEPPRLNRAQRRALARAARRRTTTRRQTS